MSNTTWRGATNHHAGEAAEQGVARNYEGRGFVLAASRWRGQAGEIDLIFRHGSAVVFVEVKQSRDFARAAALLSDRQMRRIYASAAEFLDGEPMGQLTEARFDVALVNASGEVQIIENAIGQT